MGSVSTQSRALDAAMTATIISWGYTMHRISRILTCALLTLGAFGAAHAQTTITSGAATFVRPATSAFDTSPTANFTGVSSVGAATDSVFETGWWFRVSGDTAESFFPVPTSITGAGDTSTAIWTDVNARGLFDARESAVVSQATPTPGGQVRMTMTITNRSASNPLTIDLFHFVDIDAGGSAASDTTVQPTVGAPLLRVTDAVSTDIGEYAGVGANAFKVLPFSATTDVAALLSDTAVTNFDNATVPLANADMTAGMQWTSRTIPPSGTLSVTAIIAINSPIVLANADVSITKTDGVTQVAQGGSTTYTITASNAGPDATAATVADTFPAACTTVTWTCVGAGGGTCTASGTSAINDAVNLPSGGSVTYTAACAISGAATGTLANTATVAVSGVTTDPNAANNTATDTNTITVASADLAITKTDGVTQVAQGGSTTYTITATNAGPDGATGATVADTFPAGCATVTWTCVGAGGGTCAASGTGNINDSVNLPTGGSVTYTATCAISGAATGTLANTATITSPGGLPDPTPGNNSATDSDTIVTQLAPVFSYNPVAGGTVNFTGGTTIGTTASASIAVSIGTPGVGTGAPATTTTTCAVPAGFAGFGQTVTAVGAAANTTGGPLTGTCVLGAAVVTATMNCSEVQGSTPPARGTGNTVTRTFTLSCPAGTAVPLTSVPVTGSLINLPIQGIGGGATTSVVTFFNPGAAAATVTCTAPAAPFSAAPTTINVPAAGSATVTVSYSSPTLGSSTGVLNCTAGAQNFTFNLQGTTAQATAVPTFGENSRYLLLLAMLAIGLVVMGMQQRRV